MDKDLRRNLVRCLRAHVNVLAWSYNDMPRIDPKVACYRFTISNEVKLVKQKMRCFNQGRYDTINNEVEKLLRV